MTIISVKNQNRFFFRRKVLTACTTALKNDSPKDGHRPCHSVWLQYTDSNCRGRDKNFIEFLPRQQFCWVRGSQSNVAAQSSDSDRVNDKDKEWQELCTVPTAQSTWVRKTKTVNFFITDYYQKLTKA